MARMKKYLLWCINEFLDMRIPELSALSSMFGLQRRFVEPPSEKPWLIVEVDCEDKLRAVMSRSILIRFCLELWADVGSMEELRRKLQEPESLEILAPYRHTSFKMVVDAYGRNMLHGEKLKKIDTFNFMPLEGEVRLKNPELQLYSYEYYGMDPNNIPDEPYRLFCGKWIADGQRARLSRFNLKERLYIGNTSMESTLAFIMTNLAKVRSGDLVFDPFCGTASILVSAAEFGASVVGSDMDYLTLHAQTKPSRADENNAKWSVTRRCRGAGENIRANFDQYDLTSRLLDVVIADAAAAKCVWRPGVVLDAVVTDPPYGIREGTKTIGARSSLATMSEEQKQRYIPTRVPYAMSDVYADLLNQSVERLKIGGRLVFWMPVIRETYSPEHVPAHPCLRLVDNCEQILSKHSGRRLIVLEKTREPVEGETAFIFSEMDEFSRRYFAGANRTAEDGEA